MAIEAGKLGYTRMFVPAENAYEAAVVTGLSVYPVPDVFTLIDHLRGTKPILPAAPYHSDPKNQPPLPDFADVKGQAQAKRALEIGRKRRAQRVAHRLARFRQKHACKAAAVHPAANVL